MKHWETWAFVAVLVLAILIEIIALKTGAK